MLNKSKKGRITALEFRGDSKIKTTKPNDAKIMGIKSMQFLLILYKNIKTALQTYQQKKNLNSLDFHMLSLS